MYFSYITGRYATEFLFACAVVLLYGCTLQYNPGQAFYCPYPEDQVIRAEQFITRVDIVPWREMNGRLGEFTRDGVIRLSDYLEGDVYDEILMHEKCHAFDLYYVGSSWIDSGNHVGWIPYARARR